MAVAMVYPKGTPGKKSAASSAAEEAGVAMGYISMARTVLADSCALAEDVDGCAPLLVHAMHSMSTTRFTMATFHNVSKK